MFGSRIYRRFQKARTIIKFDSKQTDLDEVRTPQFQILPKVHKTNIPGRPVVSSVECHTSKISEFVNHYLQSHVRSLTSCINDISDFTNRINETKDINKDTTLVTFDVKPLYVNIPNHEGMHVKFCISKADCYESYQFFVFNTNTQHFCIQWNSLSAKNRMCHGNNMCTKLHYHFHEKI